MDRRGSHLGGFEAHRPVTRPSLQSALINISSGGVMLFTHPPGCCAITRRKPAGSADQRRKRKLCCEDGRARAARAIAPPAQPPLHIGGLTPFFSTVTLLALSAAVGRLDRPHEDGLARLQIGHRRVGAEPTITVFGSTTTSVELPLYVTAISRAALDLGDAADMRVGHHAALAQIPGRLQLGHGGAAGSGLRPRAACRPCPSSRSRRCSRRRECR